MVEKNCVRKKNNVVKIVLLAGVLPFIFISGSLICGIVLLGNWWYNNPNVPWMRETGKWVSQTPYIEIESTSLGKEEVYGQLQDKDGNLIDIIILFWRPRYSVTFFIDYGIGIDDKNRLFDSGLDVVGGGFLLTHVKIGYDTSFNYDLVFNEKYEQFTFYKV
ncbi:MAG: hypothetical protein FWF56_05120 [Firmicutes bacterium]|nr:hypothetical protein [Bacillota bacterium]MCL1953352.1 hypothetical protein [Bacillota bacterium]